jgi:hypothetical protein
MGAFVKRLVVQFKPPGRAVKLNMETHLDQMKVVSVLELPHEGEPFPGHDRINHTLGVLEVDVRQDWQDWRGALQHMKGYVHPRTSSATAAAPAGRGETRSTAPGHLATALRNAFHPRAIPAAGNAAAHGRGAE